MQTKKTGPIRPRRQNEVQITTTAPKERLCIATGDTASVDGLVRFVTGPDARIVPDILEKLPGRGMWVASNRAALTQAIKKSAFRRAARGPVEINENLPDLVCELLSKSALDLLGLARKAGAVVQGFTKVEQAIRQGDVAVLVVARDGAEDSLRKISALTKESEGLKRVDSFSRDELGLAFGRENVVHAALKPGRLTDRFLREARRLDGFRLNGQGS